MKILSVFVAVVLILHGLIHLLGTVTYMKLGAVQGLTYKTTLLGGRWNPGESGMAVYGAFWALAALGFLFAAIALLTDAQGWRLCLALTALFSLALTALDWQTASAGAILNLVILAGLGLVALFGK